MLALVPAGFLILLILGALAVDSGAAYLGQRDLSATLEAAANDAAGAAVSDSAFYGKGALEIDPSQAATIVCQDVDDGAGSDVVEPTVAMAVAGGAVYVEAHAEVPAVFGRSIPGLGRRPVSARAVAVASGDRTPPPPPPPASYVPLSC